MHKMRFLLASSVVLGLLFGLAGCGGGGGADGTRGVITVTIDQTSPVSIAPNGTQQFTATVTGTVDTSVVWSVQEGTGGSFSQTTAGLYTAPAAVGTYHVIATSVADPQASTSATVNVTSGGGNTAPTASFTVNPSSGPPSTSFAVDASGSTDAQDPASALQVRWDWENDGTWDTSYSATKTANHTYSSPGSYTIKLEVKDTGGLLGTATRPVTVTSSAGATLTLTLDATVDVSSGSAKATSLSSAALLDTSGSSAATGTVNGGSAQFDMAGLAAGMYFVEVNNLSDDLVPVRIDNPSVNLSAIVGTRLMDVYIGSKASPTYRMRTFPAGQGSAAVAKYSNGTTATPTRYSYAILIMASQKVEIRVLGTAALLTSYSTGGEHSFPNWLVGASNHGLSYGGNDGRCSGCHNTLSNHPAAYSSVNDGNGWCYKCHYGKSGSTAGSVDPAQ